MQEDVTGQDVGVGFGAALGIDGTGDVVELVEKVETVEHEEHSAFEEGTGKSGVPHEVGGVELRVGVPCSGV